MLERFSEKVDAAQAGEKAALRAVQCWQILTARAHNNSMMSYLDLAKMMGYKDARPLTPILHHIMCYCDQSDLPPLTSIVVSKESGVPGEGFTSVKPENIDQKRMQVFQYNWFDIVPPSAEQFKKAYEQNKD